MSEQIKITVNNGNAEVDPDSIPRGVQVRVQDNDDGTIWIYDNTGIVSSLDYWIGEGDDND